MRSSKLFILFFTGLLCAISFLFVFAFPAHKREPSASQARILLDDHPVTVVLARTEAEQERGLSGATALAADHGMLFLFPKPDLWGIWMKDMKFPIDVIWFDLSGQAAFIKENFLPSSYPEEVIPTSPTSSILEVPAGFVAQHQIHLGSLLVLPKDLPRN